MITNLDVHLDHSLPNEGGAEECPEWNKEVATCDACQVEQGVWNAGGKSRDIETFQGEMVRNSTWQLRGCQRSQPSQPTAGSRTWLARTWTFATFFNREGNRKIGHRSLLLSGSLDRWTPTLSSSPDSSTSPATLGTPQYPPQALPLGKRRIKCEIRHSQLL